MRRLKLSGLLCLFLCAVMAFAACASKDGDSKKEKATETPTASVTETVTPNEEPTAEPTKEPTEEPTPTPEITVSFDFDKAESDIERMLREAAEQYAAEDYTRLSEPVKYYVLWIGFTHVTFGDLDFQI